MVCSYISDYSTSIYLRLVWFTTEIDWITSDLEQYIVCICIRYLYIQTGI